jgi:hypothetical protein
MGRVDLNRFMLGFSLLRENINEHKPSVAY